MDENPYRAPEGIADATRGNRPRASLLRDVLWLGAFAVLLALGLMLLLVLFGGVLLYLGSLAW
ncbi:MAG: hypothetical protein K2Y37_08235 [Pirellulales bacterium]|nr:hypothetical protein [Pirellulales bacterium]